MWSRIATQKKTNENTVTDATNSMIRVEVQCRLEGDLYGSWEGAQSPSGKGLKGGGIPPIPPLFEGSNWGDGKARDPEYKRWDRSRLRLSAVGL